MLNLPEIVRQVGPPADDAELLRRFARTRDAAAFGLILRRHGPAVWGVCAALLPGHQDREDAFQAVFAALAEHAGRVRCGAALPAWLRRCARNAALDLLTRPAAVALESDVISAEASPATVAESAEAGGLIGEEVARLPEPFREAFVLCHFHGLSNAAAAERLGCAVGTVESRLTRARRRLRSHLRRRGLGMAAVAVPAGVLGRAVEAVRSPAAVTLAGRLAPPASVKGPLAAVALLLLSAVAILAAVPPADRPGDEPAPRSRQARWRHPGPIQAAAFSPDGKLAAAAGVPEQGWPAVTVWGRRGTVRRRFRLPQSGPTELAFGKDGGLYAVCFGPKWAVVRLDVAAGTRRTLIERKVPNWGYMPSPMMLAGDASFVAAVGEGGRRLTARSLPGGEVMSTWVSPGDGCRLGQLRGRRAVVYDRGDNQTRAWVVDLATGKTLWSGRNPKRLTAKLSPDGRTLMTFGRPNAPGPVRLWDVATGRRVGGVTPTAEDNWDSPFFAGGEHVGVVTGNRRRLSRFTFDGRLTHSRKIERWHRPSPRLSADGRFVLAGVGGHRKSLGVWDARTLERRHLLPGGTPLASSPGGSLFVAFGGGSAGVLNLGTGDITASEPRGAITAAAFGPDGRLVTWGQTPGLLVWGAAAGTHRRLPIPDAAVPYDRAALSADGRRFARVTEGERLEVFALPSGRRLLDVPASPGDIDRLWFSADGRRLAALRRIVPEIIEWDVADGSRTSRPFGRAKRPNFRYAFTPGGRYAIAMPYYPTFGMESPETYRFDRATGAVTELPVRPVSIGQVEFTADGRLAALTPVYNRQEANAMLAVLEMATGRVVSSIEVGRTPADLTFAPDGRSLAVFFPDGRLRLFDVAANRFTHTFVGHRGPGFAVFSADGRRLAGVSGDAPVIIHRVPPAD